MSIMNSVALPSVRRGYKYWHNGQHHRSLLDKLAESLGIQTQAEWYTIKGTDIRKLNAGSFLQFYNGSIYAALISNYSEFIWNPLLFYTVPMNYWSGKENRRKTFDWLAEELQIETQQDWYNVSAISVKELGAAGLLSEFYNNSLVSALMDLYPQYQWDPYQFQFPPRSIQNCVPAKYWKEKKNQRQFLDALGEELGIQTQEDWYYVSTSDLSKFRTVLFGYYKSSIFAALQAIYPEFDWNPLLRKSRPKRYLTNTDPQLIQEYLNMSKSERRLITSSQAFHYSSKRFGRLNLLQRLFPDTDWLSQIRGSKGELMLENVLKRYTRVEREKKFQSHVVDLYLPELSVAIEYQGVQHYKAVENSGMCMLDERKVRDNNKRKYFKQLGITLIEVPYWWKGNFFTLFSTFGQLQHSDMLNPSVK